MTTVVDTMMEDFNPFVVDGLQTADSRKVLMSALSEKCVFEARHLGLQKYSEFVQDRLTHGKKVLEMPLQEQICNSLKSNPKKNIQQS